MKNPARGVPVSNVDSFGAKGVLDVKGNEYEICGIFGVDTIANGKCPDGVQYDWDKSSRIGRVKKEKDFQPEIVDI